MPLVPDSATAMPGPSFMSRSSSTMGFEVPLATRCWPRGVSDEVNARWKASVSIPARNAEKRAQHLEAINRFRDH
jgi:hypothetical protein